MLKKKKTCPVCRTGNEFEDVSESESESESEPGLESESEWEEFPTDAAAAPSVITAGSKYEKAAAIMTAGGMYASVSAQSVSEINVGGVKEFCHLGQMGDFNSLYPSMIMSVPSAEEVFETPYVKFHLRMREAIDHYSLLIDLPIEPGPVEDRGIDQVIKEDYDCAETVMGRVRSILAVTFKHVPLKDLANVSAHVLFLHDFMHRVQSGSIPQACMTWSRIDLSVRGTFDEISQELKSWRNKKRWME